MTDETAEKRVAWAELYFDLVVVFAVTQVSSLLHADHSWAGAGRALIAFIPIYWVWVGTTVHANTRDADKPLDRLGIFAVGLCGLVMALAMPGAYGDRGVLFGAAYLAARAVLAVLVFRDRPLSFGPVSLSVVLTGPLLLAGGFFDGGWRTALWGCAALVDLSTPRLTRRTMMHLPFNAGHLAERFGLFVIIALGESIVAVGAPAASADHLRAGTVAAVASAFALACGLWWVYFHFAADAVRHGLQTAAIPADIVRQVLSYGHLAFIGAIIAVAVGMAETVAHPGEHLHAGVAALLYGGCALYLGTYGYTRWRLFRKWSTTRVVAALVVLALLPAATVIPCLAALVVLTTAVAILNLTEYVLVARHGELPGGRRV